MNPRHEGAKPSAQPQQKNQARKAKDPVCGAEVDMDKPGAQARIEGKDQYFCGTGCRDKFQKEHPVGAGSGGGRHNV